jgi:hypothetical protein
MEPDKGDDPGREVTAWRLVRLADWCQSVGAVLAVVTVICVLLDVVTAQQAVAVGLPSVVLIVVGLIIAAGPDTAIARRHGFHVGLQVRSLLNLWSSLFK